MARSTFPCERTGSATAPNAHGPAPRQPRVRLATRYRQLSPRPPPVRFDRLSATMHTWCSVPIRKVLGSLGLSAEVPVLAAARSPPRQGELEFEG